MKKILTLSVALLMGYTAVFSAANVQAQSYSDLLNQFQNAISNTTTVTTPAPAPTPGSDVLTGRVTCTATGECFIKVASGKTYRLLGRVMATQILRAVVYDQVTVAGTLNPAGTVLGNITMVTPLTGVSQQYAPPAPLPSSWRMATYTGWIIVNAQGNVFLRRYDANAKNGVMVSGGVPVEIRLLNSINWRLPYTFIGKGLVNVTGIVNDKTGVMRYNNDSAAIQLAN